MIDHRTNFPAAGSGLGTKRSISIGGAAPVTKSGGEGITHPLGSIAVQNCDDAAASHDAGCTRARLQWERPNIPQYVQSLFAAGPSLPP